MKRKHRISTREVYKWKARLTVDGSKQKYGVHYNKTYSPVMMLATTWFFLIQSILLGWHTRQVDFTLAYPQADIECPLYMEVPKGVQVEVGGTTLHMLRSMSYSSLRIYMARSKPAASGTCG